MMSQPRGGRPSRAQSALKRQAILQAARDLFVSEGVDRVSMDAVAAKAQVSKATVYEHFGDKQNLFTAILHDASSSMTATAQRVLDEHLSDDAPIRTVEELEAALTAAMIDLGDAMVSSDEYSAVFALVAQHRQRTSDPTSDVSTEVVEEAFAERIRHFVGLGLLDTEDPRTAADHFTALTMLLAYNQQPIAALVDPERVKQTMIDGVRLFIRGYRARAHE
ncbi:TetR/AcrR family transcriptional regulator [Microbacterium marinilacus]|uniref:TetR/AcrR family transcriptional regulator n=1 Tax=Microbacterium marinilacus TaxID=415209 RepID=A0ABP7BT39_9MICO|nr:TetR/AcrR family transcriptional regulator [Microbacterium marinilacus]MBY0690472.1 TetR/AcrR family transcriptional regulator [Microbacterium marinilacus]